MRALPDIQKFINRFLTAFICLILWQGCFKFRTSDPKTLQQFKEKGIEAEIKEYYDAANHKIHYVETGASDAPTIFFIHGTPGSWNNFKKFLSDSLLIEAYRMVSIDRPGFGYSNFGKALDMEAQVNLFNQFVQSKNNNKPVILIGHSLGGPILVGMAAGDTTIAHTLLLLAASVSPELEPAEKWRKPLASPALRWLSPGAMRPSNDEMIDFKEYVKKMPALLEKITCRVYLIHGTNDMFVPYENVAYAERFLTHTTDTYTSTFQGENHFIPWTKFEELRDLLLFIRKDFN